MAIFWVLVIVGILLLVRFWRGSENHRGFVNGKPPYTDPEQTLANRFAAGEIDADEFQHRLEVLRKSRPPSR